MQKNVLTDPFKILASPEARQDPKTVIEVWEALKADIHRSLYECDGDDVMEKRLFKDLVEPVSFIIQALRAAEQALPEQENSLRSRYRPAIDEALHFLRQGGADVTDPHMRNEVILPALQR